MKIFSNVSLVLAIGAMIFGTSCVSSKKHKDLMAERDALQNRFDKCEADKGELKAQMTDLEKEQGKLKTELANANRNLESADKKLMDCQKMTEQKEAQINNIKKQIKDAMTSINEGNLSVQQKDVKLYVSLSNEILYRPGSADISKEGKEVIGQLAEVFKNNGDMHVMVEGHTDDSPIRRSRYLYKDNWDLSCARASNVVRELVNAGVSAGNLTVAGRADQDNKDITIEGAKEGAEDRRIEFVITPSIEGFNKL